MSYRELAPPSALRSYVDRFWTRAATLDVGVHDDGRAGSARAQSAAAAAESSAEQRDAGTPAPRAPARILPDGCIDVLIDVHTGATRVVGTMTRAVLDGVPAGVSLAAVRFKPGAARAFLRVPAATLTDRVLEASELGCGWLSTRPAPDAGAASLASALTALERALLARLPAGAPQAEVREATRRLFAARAPTVDALARDLGRSRQHLARQFRENVGLSPKEFARVARLQRAIAALQHARRAGLAELALDLGYYDQAHMTRDFSELAGLTPRAAREARGSLFPIPSLWLED